MLFSLCVFLFCIYTSNSSWAAINKEILPKKENIIEKNYYNELVKIKDVEELNYYLDALNEQELLLTIAQTSEEFEKRGAYSELSIFANSFDKKLLHKLTEEDYITILQNEDYSTTFKIFMTDAYCYSTQKNKKQMGIKFNNMLKNIIKNNKEDAGLRFYALKSATFSHSDVDFLTHILNTKYEDVYIKTSAMIELKRLKGKEMNSYLRNIIDNARSYSAEEIVTAMNLIVDSANKDDINKIGKVLQDTNDIYIRDGAVFTLGDIRDADTVKVIIDNRNKINDDSLIAYFVDKNFITVCKMLKSNDNQYIKYALECVDIAPYVQFMPILEDLINNNEDTDIIITAKSLIEKAIEKSYQHNIKWDER